MNIGLKIGKGVMVKVGDGWVEMDIIRITRHERERTNSVDIEVKHENYSIEITDVFEKGWGKWRAKNCDSCKWVIKEGGDLVPYGDTMVRTPVMVLCGQAEEDLVSKTYYGTQCEKYETPI